ncbi:MAG: hypothetical protein ACKOQ6_07255, partial [Bacteroidota bacterium]
MRNNYTPKLKIALWILTIGFVFSIGKSQAAPSVSMITDQCAAGANWIEFRHVITNTSNAGETLYIQAPGT